MMIILKQNIMNATQSNHQVTSNIEQDKNENYRVMSLILEKKIEKISSENERLAAR